MSVKHPGIAVPHLSRYDLRPLVRPLQGLWAEPGPDGCVSGEVYGDGAIFSLQNRAFAPGWYMAEVLIESNQSYLDAAFTLVGGGRKSRRLRLPLRSGRLGKRLIWLARSGERLQFSPAQCCCEFKIQRLTLVRVSLLFAWDRMRARLSSRLLRVPPRLINRWACYDATFRPDGARVSYWDWVKRIEPTLWPQPRAISARVHFSLLMPIGADDAIGAIRAAVDSVRAQCCKTWKLILLPTASLSKKTAAELSRIAAADDRVRVVAQPEIGLDLAEVSGEGVYHLLFPPRAVLAPTALSCLRYAIECQPQARIIYADEDLLNEAGRRSSPRFKPAWNPDLLYSHNYIGEFVLYAPGVLERAGPLDFAAEEAWDYALLLRALHQLGDPQREVAHVPRVLFHRCGALDQDGYLQSCRRILERLLTDKRGQVAVDYSANGEALHVRWPLPEKEPLVSLLIPTRDMLPILRQCIDSILEKTSYRNYEILVLDNQSVERETLEYLSKLEALPNVRVLEYDAPFNYSAINNFGVQHARGEIIGLVNNDIEVISPDWLVEMVRHAARPDIGCVGAKLYYGDGRIQHAGVVVGLGGLAGHANKFHQRDAAGYMNRLVCTQNYSAVTAACLLLRKSIYEEVGGLDEKHFVVAFNDVDLCLKVKKAGYRNLWTPWAEMYHHESISRGIDNTPEKRARFEQEAKSLKARWSTLPGKDPCYSPFLTHTREDFSLGLNERIEAPFCR